MWARPRGAWAEWRAWLGLGPQHSIARRPWRPPPRQPLEDAMARAVRFAADRRHLAWLDERLLRDVGLDREAVTRGLPFAAPTFQRLSIPRIRSNRHDLA
ncbi:DUF1127 domain-containing protein [Roseomonas sp. E05]|uniref:DUF1127 domain-containing protein n=1 Tax=Roseomonas sp. E05 TaxID=3046310 RepID=UPI0038D21E59